MSTIERMDALVVGAGPAGLAATGAMAEAGLSVRAIDEQAAGGGQIWRNAERLADRPPEAMAALRALDRPNVSYAPGATVVDATLDGETHPVGITWLPGAGVAPRRMQQTRARALVIATGAMERPVLFPGAALPGVMGVGALQAVMKQAAMAPTGVDGGGGVVLAGQGPLLLLTLAQIARAGGRVDAVLSMGGRGALLRSLGFLPNALAADPRMLAQGLRLLWRSRVGDVARFHGVSRLRANGTESVESVTFATDGRSERERTVPCRLLAVHDGVVPNTQLTRLLDLEHEWREAQAAFVPVTDASGRSSQPHVWIAGDGAGVAGAELATLRGDAAGRDVARALGKGMGEGNRDTPRRAVARRLTARAFVDRLYAPLVVDAHATPDTLVCRCEAVTMADIERAIAAGAVGPNRVKTFTRCGMGACQGRMCANALTRLIAKRTGAAPDDVGALRIRPPLKPVLIADYLTGEESA